ncbi:MAG TPA: gephyrin-like molybdotransferase Glp [Methylomirabilota bacterium]|nr:gephyrin-like molybdotransferase Glp [Methylomirabilota bacterium]
MISVPDALSRILSAITRVVPPELIPVANSLGRVLATDVRAPFNVPPSDNSAVDGYAVSNQDIPTEGLHALRVIGDLPAGTVFDQVVQRGEAIRIMTGAPLPKGVDTVLPQEVVRTSGDKVLIPPIKVGSNVRCQGEDVQQGAVVLQEGLPIRPQEMGLLTSLGIAQLLVRQKPRVAILSTGNEVAEPGKVRSPGQIYDANRFTLSGLVQATACDTVDFGIVPDSRDRLKECLLEAAQAADVVITSGGVSVGAYDLVKDVLTEIGGIDFWQVAMQPGRPMAHGQIGQARFFGLPGNPVASMLTFFLFVRPALWKLAGRKELAPQRFTAVAIEPLKKKTGRQEFKRGILSFQDREWRVQTTGPQGSGILTSMVLANCFIVLEEDRGDVSAGEIVWVEPFQF